MTVQNFVNVLKAIGEKKTRERVRSNVPVIYRKEENLDLVPVNLSQEFAIESGNTTSYLLEKAQEYRLTLRNLKDLIYLKKEYSTNFSKMLEVMDRGYSIDEIHELLNVREELSLVKEVIGKKNKARVGEQVIFHDRPSFDCIIEFYERFGSEPLDASLIASQMQHVHDELKTKFLRYMDVSIEDFLDRAREIDSSTIEATLDYMAGRYPEFVKVTDDQNEED